MQGAQVAQVALQIKESIAVNAVIAAGCLWRRAVGEKIVACEGAQPVRTGCVQPLQHLLAVAAVQGAQQHQYGLADARQIAPRAAIQTALQLAGQHFLDQCYKLGRFRNV